MRDTVLVVRHGRGRGRIPKYGEHILEWLRAERPDLAGRTLLHETGTGPVSLDEVCAVFFWLADPLQIKYPDCYEETTAIQEEAERRSLPMINRPTALATYGKSEQANRFTAANVPTPRAIRIESPSDLAGCIDRLGLPLLIRGGQSFSQEGTFIVRSRRDIESVKREQLPEQAIVTALMDVRGPRVGSRSGDLWTRYYHRKRVLLIGGQCAPFSLFFARTPVVDQGRSLYSEFHSWQTRLRRHGWLGKRALRVLKRRLGVSRALELEREFAESPVDHEDVFRRAGVALGLEFLAFDFASLPSGKIVIWEANPYPYIPPASQTLLSHSRKRSESILSTYRAFAQCLESLLGSAADP